MLQRQAIDCVIHKNNVELDDVANVVCRCYVKTFSVEAFLIKNDALEKGLSGRLCYETIDLLWNLLMQ